MITDALGNELKIGDLVMYASGKQYYNLVLNVGVIKKFYRQWTNDPEAEPNFAQIFTIRGKKLMTNPGGIASRSLKGVIKCPQEIAVKYDFVINLYNEYLNNKLHDEDEENNQ